MTKRVTGTPSERTLRSMIASIARQLKTADPKSAVKLLDHQSRLAESLAELAVPSSPLSEQPESKETQTYNFA